MVTYFQQSQWHARRNISFDFIGQSADTLKILVSRFCVISFWCHTDRIYWPILSTNAQPTRVLHYQYQLGREKWNTFYSANNSGPTEMLANFARHTTNNNRPTVSADKNRLVCHRLKNKLLSELPFFWVLTQLLQPAEHWLNIAPAGGILDVVVNE